MSEPRRLTFQSPADLPPVGELLRHLDRQHHLVLQFPIHAVEGRKPDLIQKLKQQLPENCSVFDAGSIGEESRITIMQVISRPELLALEDELLQGARHFRQTALRLAYRLACHNGVRLDRLSEHFADLEPFEGDWTIAPHGEHICFKHQQTGQIVEVNMWFGKEFGVLDPEFFHTYLRTTPGLRCPPEIVNDFHDSALALKHLEARGWLTRIDGMHGRSGLFAPDE